MYVLYALYSYIVKALNGKKRKRNSLSRSYQLPIRMGEGGRALRQNIYIYIEVVNAVEYIRVKVCPTYMIK